MKQPIPFVLKKAHNQPISGVAIKLCEMTLTLSWHNKKFVPVTFSYFYTGWGTFFRTSFNFNLCISGRATTRNEFVV